MNELTWSTPNLYNMQVILGMPSHLMIAIAPNLTPEDNKFEVYLVNRNIRAFTKQKHFFGTLKEVRAEGSKWARELTGNTVHKTKEDKELFKNELSRMGISEEDFLKALSHYQN